MGTLVGGLILLVNAVNIVSALGDLPLWLDVGAIIAIIAVTGYVAYHAWQREQRERAATSVREPVVLLD
jgi:heme A synthase